MKRHEETDVGQGDSRRRISDDNLEEKGMSGWVMAQSATSCPPSPHCESSFASSNSPH